MKFFMLILSIISLLIAGCGTTEKMIDTPGYRIHRIEGNKLNNVNMELNAQKYINKVEKTYFSFIVLDKRGKVPGGVEKLVFIADGKKFTFENPDKGKAGEGPNDQLSGSWYRFKATKEKFVAIVFSNEVYADIKLNRSVVHSQLSQDNLNKLRKFYNKHK